MRDWIRCGIALLCGSGLLALADGWLQFSNAEPFFQKEMASFALLNAWALCFPLWFLLGAAKKALKNPVGTAFWAGIAVGLVPIAVAWVPAPFHFLVGLVVLIAAALPQVANLQLPEMPRTVLTVLFGVFLVASPFLPQTSASMSPDTYVASEDGRPHPTGVDVFLISIDTLRADALVDDPNTPGDSTAPTPFLDRMREQSLWADYGLSSSNQTLPGHVGMLTGVDAMVHGVRSNLDLPDPSVPLISEEFQKRGWKTSGVISNALLSASTGMHRGYDSYSDEPIGLASYSLMLTDTIASTTWAGFLFSKEGTRAMFQRIYFRRQLAQKEIPLADRVMDAALPQLAANYADSRPFFHFVHFMDPHTAYRPPLQLRGTLSGELAPKVAKRFLPSPTADLSLEMVREVEEALKAGDEEAILAAKYYHLVYLEEMVYVDQQLERFFTKVEKSGRPYVALVTADHGEQFGEHNLMDHANSLYEKNVQVPFMIWGSGVTPGHLQMVPHSADIAPTLLSLAGLKVPAAMTGQVVNLEAKNRPQVTVDQLEVAIRDADGLKWTGAWRLSEEEPRQPIEGDPNFVRLIDLQADPMENNPHSDGDKATPKSLLKLRHAFLDKDTWKERQEGAVMTPAQLAAIEQMGYVGQEDDREGAKPPAPEPDPEAGD
ncbi:MAG: sulfatase-like hydrolase/transferase [Planctomycetota bacterium]